MSIILQNKESQEFVGLSPGTWTFHGEKAQVFLNGLDAMVYCFKRRLSNMQILVRFKNAAMNFTVQVTDVHAN